MLQSSSFDSREKCTKKAAVWSCPLSILHASVTYGGSSTNLCTAAVLASNLLSMMSSLLSNLLFGLRALVQAVGCPHLEYTLT